MNSSLSMEKTDDIICCPHKFIFKQFKLKTTSRNLIIQICLKASTCQIGSKRHFLSMRLYNDKCV